MAKKITFIALVSGILPVLLLFFFIAYTSWQQVNDATEKQVNDGAQVRVQVLEQQMEKIKQILLATSANPAFHKYFESPEGSADQEQWRRIVKENLLLLNKSFKGIAGESCFIAADGRELARCTAEELAPDADLSDDESGASFYKPALETLPGNVVPVGPYDSPDAGVPVEAFVTPIASNSFNRGLLHVETPLAYFAERLNGIATVPGMRVFLMDGEGRVLLDNKAAVPKEAKFQPFKDHLPGNWFTAKLPLEKNSGVTWQVMVALPVPGFAEFMRQMGGGLVVSTLGILLCLLIAWRLSRRMARPVVKVIGAMEQLASGDLTVEEVPQNGHDEIGRLSSAFNHMVRDLRHLIGRIQDVSSQVHGNSDTLAHAVAGTSQAAQQISKAIEEVAKGASEQAHSADRTTAVMRGLAEAIEQTANGNTVQSEGIQSATEFMTRLSEAMERVAARVEQVADASRQALSSAKNGDQTVGAVVAGMERIRDRSQAALGRVRHLAEQSRQVGDIVHMIGDIADQTNMLALNAAIEAARAGEQGKGFAVVAEEVRKLAENASRATNEIHGLITEIQRGVEEAVAAMESGGQEVNAGGLLVADAGQALTGILEAMAATDHLVQDISSAIGGVSGDVIGVASAMEHVAVITQESVSATQRMTTAKEQVAQSVVEVAAISQQTAAASEQVSASTQEVNATAREVDDAARQLASLAEEMKVLVEGFRLG